MKRLFLLLTSAFLLINAVQLSAQAIWDGSIDTDWAGTGTFDDPYLISSAAELAGVAEATSKGNSFEHQYLRLTADITLNDTTDWRAWSPKNQPANRWKPIGTDTTKVDVDFEGYFDGANHTISGLFFCDTLDSYISCGLFAEIFCATIENINLKATYIYTIGWSAGAVVGKGAYESYKNRPLVVKNCTTDAIVSGEDYVGGIIGVAIYGSVTNCHSSGQLFSTQGRAGGIAGDIDGVYDCSSSMDIFGAEGEMVGGVAGVAGQIINSHSSGKVIGKKKVGGLAGTLSSDFDQKVRKCYATGDVVGVSYVGGLAGDSNTDTIVNCYATGNVTSEGGYYVGGLIGGITFIEKGLYAQCYATGNVLALPNKFDNEAEVVGGLVGYVSYAEDATFSQCYSSGHVTGKKMVGGLIGDMAGPSLRDCYSRGTITGDENVGGLIGRLRSDSIMNCYAAGKVIGNTAVNGIVGIYHNNDNTLSELISNTHFDAEVASVPESDFARTTAEMHKQATFAEWDFTDIWAIDATKNGGYPYLKGLPLFEPKAEDDNTSIPSIVSPSTNKAQKIYRDGQIYILRGENVYLIDGQRIK